MANAVMEIPPLQLHEMEMTTERIFQKVCKATPSNPCDIFPTSVHMPLYPGEFGSDNLLNIPVAYFLHTCGKLASTQGCGDMSAFYWFSPNHTNQLGCRRIPQETLKGIDIGEPTMCLQDIFSHAHRPAAWRPVPFLQHYFPMPNLKSPKGFMNAPMQLVIVNKYTREWGREPQNFLSYALLSAVIEQFQSTCGKDARILYSRGKGGFSSEATETGGPGGQPAGSDGELALMDDTGKNTDWDLMQRHEHVETIHDIVAANPDLSSNEIKLRAMTRSKCFLSVQGGAGVPVFYFGGKNIVLKKEGRELITFFKEFAAHFSGQEITMVQTAGHNDATMLQHFQEQMLADACNACRMRKTWSEGVKMDQ
jgi:hypothetical protein